MKIKLCLLAVIFTGLQINLAAEGDLSKLAVANNDFAFKLLTQLTVDKKGGNIFISPYSAATALQMAANGAGGQTKSEMQQVLNTTGLPMTTVNAASKAAALLNSTDTNLILTTANALWYRQDVAIRTNFLAANQKYFSATIKALDFGNVPAAEAEINQWASDQTHGRITGIADGMINPYADLILANAIYFKGKWEEPFEERLTKDRPFHPATSAVKNVPMMEMSKKFMYRTSSGYQAVRLPYLGGDVAMYIFLPDPGSDPEKLLSVMNGDKWRRVTAPGFGEQEGMLVLPKFKLENTCDLNGPLKALGMKTAFDRDKADFSGMFAEPHYISRVVQKTFVEVKEEGTEAAAVTTMQFSSWAMIMPTEKPFKMVVDRPFLFTIVDARSGIILFMGVVNDL